MFLVPSRPVFPVLVRSVWWWWGSVQASRRAPTRPCWPSCHALPPSVQPHSAPSKYHSYSRAFSAIIIEPFCNYNLAFLQLSFCLSTVIVQLFPQLSFSLFYNSSNIFNSSFLWQAGFHSFTNDCVLCHRIRCMRLHANNQCRFIKIIC